MNRRRRGPTHLRQPSASADRGSVLAVGLVCLTVLGMLVLAGFDSADFARRAARAQVDAVAALHAADAGVELYVAGSGPETGTLSVAAPPGEALVTVTALIRLPSEAELLRVVSEGRAPVGTERVIRRRVGILVRRDSSGGRRRVPGTWRELF